MKKTRVRGIDSDATATAGMLLGLAAGLTDGVGMDENSYTVRPRKEWKPKFTEEELEHGRSLNKKEKKKYFADLRQQYRLKENPNG